MTGQNTASESSQPKLFDAREIVVIFVRHKRPILIAVAIVLALTAILYLFQEKQFTSVARIAVERQNTDLVDTNSGGRELTTDSPSVDTEVHILESPEVMRRAAEELGLANKPGYGLPEDGGDEDDEPSIERAANTLSANSEVTREGESYAITLEYTDNDPEMAHKITQAIVAAYIGGQQSDKGEQRTEEIDFLADRIKNLKEELLAAETEVARYRASTNLVDIKGDSTAAQQELSVLGTQLANAQAEAAAAQARAEAARQGAISNVVTSPVVNQLREQRARLLAQQQSLMARYGEKHPTIINIENQLDAINRSLAAEQANLNSERANIQAAVVAEARAAQNRVQSIRGSLNRAEGELMAGNNASVRLAELEREAESTRQLYQAFLDRYRLASAAQGTERSNAYVIAEASLPIVPSFPSLPAFGLGGLLAALLAGTLTAIGFEANEKGFRSRRAVEDALDVRVIAAIPDVATMSETQVATEAPLELANYLLEDPESVFGESFRSIITALGIGMAPNAPKTVALTSSLASEGKTTSSICLARTAANMGLRTLIIDCDVRRRAVSRALLENIEYGLRDVLNGEASVENAIVMDPASGAHVLPQRGGGSLNYSLAGSPAMEKLLNHLKSLYDLIILDTAPVIPVAESRAISAMADSVLLIVRWRKTPTSAVELALDALNSVDANVDGCILSLVDIRDRSESGSEYLYYERYDSVD